MAGSYTTSGSIVTTQIAADGTAADVVQVNCTATPSGVAFPVRVPVADFNSSGVTAIDASASAIASALNALAANPNVASVQVLQDINAASQIVDTAHIIVQLPGGAYQSEVVETLQAVVTSDPSAVIAQAVGSLQSLPGSTPAAPTATPAQAQAA